MQKRERLKSRKLIEQLFNQGKSFSVFPFKIYWMLAEGSETPGPLCFGVGAGSRHFKKAVDRNRIKRITRECYRLEKPPLQELLKQKQKSLSVFFIYTGKELPEYSLVREKLVQITGKLIKLIDENNTTGS